MRAVQIGILAALIVCAGLLFKVYRGQQTPAAPVPAQVATPVEPAQPEAAATPVAAEPAPAPAVAAAEPVPERRKPSPSRVAAEPKPAQPVEATPVQAPATPALAPPVLEKPAEARTPLNPPAGTQAAPPASPAPRVPHTVTVASGTIVPVRLSETLSSDKSQPGEAFAATLDQPLVIDGFVIAERGARLQGRIVEAQKAGRVSGVSALAIQITHLRTSDGQDIAIQTETFTKEGPTSKAEDAKKVGIGAALGAAIGAIAGGGKGAAIGAGVGGGAGAGTVIATRGKAAQLPVETRIPFRLTEAVTITEKLK